MSKRKKREVNLRTLALFRMGGMIATCEEIDKAYPVIGVQLKTAAHSILEAMQKLKREVPN